MNAAVLERLKASSFIKTFSRSQVSSLLATAADWGLLFSLTELAHVWYVIAVPCGTLTGGITNFAINRIWSFEARDAHWHGQALRYALTSGGSMLLNTGGVYLLTELAHIHYSLSVVIIGLAVGWGFNYPMQRHFVFRSQGN